MFIYYIYRSNLEETFHNQKSQDKIIRPDYLNRPAINFDIIENPKFDLDSKKIIKNLFGDSIIQQRFQSPYERFIKQKKNDSFGSIIKDKNKLSVGFGLNENKHSNSEYICLFNKLNNNRQEETADGYSRGIIFY